ncbi:MAG TPA: orotidine-5'-phosphate decarboxylase [Pirellulales bacterium]|nr:orotidine-5'-phosphate decarboxylase [Pirellulales bacterium]
MQDVVQPFSDRLATAIRLRRTPAIVGLDPRLAQLPEALLKSCHNAGLERQAAAFTEFCCGVIDVVASLVPAVKPQAAFFEELGPHGTAALADVIAYARRLQLLVILDAKRNDIGSTAEAYARGYLGADSPWGADGLTVSPYLGNDSLTPFVEVARQRRAGLFVLAKTSNPGGGQFQDLPSNGRPFYRHVAEYIEQLAIADAGSCGYGSVGAVVGATYPEQLAELRSAMPHAWILIPGFGSQGATARDVAAGFDKRGLGAIVNNSRGIIFAYSRREYADRFSPLQWQDAVAAATRDMIDRLRSDTPAGNLMTDH